MPQPAPMQDEDVFAEFRNQFRAAKDPAAKKALMQQLEDAMYEQMRTHLQPEYDEMETLDQPPAAPKGGDIYSTPEYKKYEADETARIKSQGLSPQEERAALDEVYMGYKPGAKKAAPQSFRPVIDEPPGHAADDMEPDGDMDDTMADNERRDAWAQQNGYDDFKKKLTSSANMDPEDRDYESNVEDGFWSQPGMEERYIGGVPTSQVDDMGPPDDEEAFADPNRGRLQYDKNGNVMRAGEGAVEEDDPDQPPYTSPLPAGSMRGAPYPVEGSEESGVGDQYYSQLYRWEKDNGAFDLEFGTPEYKKFIQDYEAKRQRGNGRQMMPGDDAMPPAGKTGMFGRY